MNNKIDLGYPPPQPSELQCAVPTELYSPTHYSGVQQYSASEDERHPPLTATILPPPRKVLGSDQEVRDSSQDPGNKRKNLMDIEKGRDSRGLVKKLSERKDRSMQTLPKHRSEKEIHSPVSYKAPESIFLWVWGNYFVNNRTRFL